MRRPLTLSYARATIGASSQKGIAMLNRVTVSLSLAVLGLVATTGIASAATESQEVMIGVGLLALGSMAALTTVYFLKRLLGVEVQGVGEITPNVNHAASDAHDASH